MLTDLDYELLSDYIDGMLNEDERTAFESRLQAEPELSHELDELRATVTLLNNLPARKAPRDFTLDARYARRSTFFFTSAAFSALSAAAAILLFALGTYLFTGKQPLTSAPASEGVAFIPTSTGATTLDKAAVTTATEPLVMNEVSPTTATPLNSPIVPADGSITNDAVVPPLTMIPTFVAGQSSLFQADNPQLTETMGVMGDIASSSAAESPSEIQQRTHAATETSTVEQESADTATGGALPAPAQVLPSTEPPQAQADASMSFAATQAPSAGMMLQLATPTLTPSLTLTLSPTLTPSATLTASPTLTLSPTLTSSPTLTPSATLTETATPQPTATLVVSQPPAATSDSLPLVLLVLGGVFLVIAVVTTLIRRQNRA